ncbi:MAG TPA: ASCH domain-containing protein [Thermomicrobiales bacterium]|nr:ASCH domain-containing protein [Thermomicrobiales bacterium]
MSERHPPVKAISLYQMWASAVARGVKRVETRSWRTEYRGILLIHASAKVPEDVAAWLDTDQPLRDLCAQHELRHRDLPKGAVVGVAYLGGCLSTDSERLDEWIVRECAEPDDEYLLGDFSPGRHGWLLGAACELRWPVKARGYPGLWTPDDRLLAEVDRAGGGILSRLGVVV